MKITHNTAISIETTFDAAIEKLWQAWTDPALVMKWFGSDPNGKVQKAKLDVRPGGYFEITFNDSDLSEHTCCGVYKDVQEFSRLTFSWTWKSEPGVESFVTLLLHANGNNTLIQFEHANLGAASKHNYLIGWQGAFEKLKLALH